MEIIPVKALLVIPGIKNDTPQIMSFIKRLAGALEAQGANICTMKCVKGANPLSFFMQGVELRRLVAKFKPDVVVAQYGTFTGLLVALFAPSPKIITYRGSDLNPTPSESRLYVFFKHLASHLSSFFADGIVCVSQEVAGRLLCNKPLEIIPSSTDIELFRPLDRSECRKMLGWERNVPIALFFAGNDPEKKRLDLALRISRIIENSTGEIQFKVIKKELPLAEVPLYLNAADCLVYLSDYEGSPNLIREACACGTPIVTVPVGDVKEVLAEVSPSKIVERDIEEIVDTVCNLAKLQCRSNGRDKVLCYSNERIAQKTLAFYRTVINSKRVECNVGR
jgi:glycosyltransferase involved in cell wall biosynthesis